MYPRWSKGRKPRLSAGGWNASMNAAEAYERSLNSGEIPFATSQALGRTIVDVRNTTGDLMQRSYVLGIDDWTLDPDSGDQLEELHENLCVEGVVPVVGTHDDNFIVLPSDLVDGEIGPAVLSGIVLVTVNIISTAHKFCTIADGDVTTLQSATSGRGRIIKAQSGTGSKWALVELARPAPVTTFRGITTGTLTKGGHVNVTRYKPGTTTASGDTDDVYNELATIASGKVVYYMDDGGKLFVFAAECPLT
jgi:hypothetical protein